MYWLLFAAWSRCRPDGRRSSYCKILYTLQIQTRRILWEYQLKFIHVAYMVPFLSQLSWSRSSRPPASAQKGRPRHHRTANMPKKRTLQPQGKTEKSPHNPRKWHLKKHETHTTSRFWFFSSLKKFIKQKRSDPYHRLHIKKIWYTCEASLL